MKSSNLSSRESSCVCSVQCLQDPAAFACFLFVPVTLPELVTMCTQSFTLLFLNLLVVVVMFVKILLLPLPL
ncbi:hypothetical protein COLO4_05692 [Corchorus olitorius]|uniref:Uncharacterized protein n=1 Tax=Corchorus olitorius TaxID=93759 RepID=A0A1R3KQ68_9ROSI|nr:hypothetical protein COLO4_05692 [Corchorus olitorius]